MSTSTWQSGRWHFAHDPLPLDLDARSAAPAAFTHPRPSRDDRCGSILLMRAQTVAEHTVVISSELPSTRASIAAVARSRSLVRSLTSRELRGRYRGSAFGFGWALVRPLVTLLVFALVVGQFLGASRLIPQFGIYLFVGLMPFSLFSAALSSGAAAITTNASLVKKVRFPREVLPLVVVNVAIVNTVIQIPILLVGYLVTNSWPTADRLILVLPASITLVVLSLACAIFLSALNVFSRDVEHLMEVILLLLFWATPIVYPWTAAVEFFDSKGLHVLSQLYLDNPLTSSIIAFQNALWPGAQTAQGSAYILFDDIWSIPLWTAPLLSLFLLYVAHRFFVRMQGNFVREL